jgi:hypothetical protein
LVSVMVQDAPGRAAAGGPIFGIGVRVGGSGDE